MMNNKFRMELRYTNIGDTVVYATGEIGEIVEIRKDEPYVYGVKFPNRYYIIYFDEYGRLRESDRVRSLYKIGDTKVLEFTDKFDLEKFVKRHFRVREFDEYDWEGNYFLSKNKDVAENTTISDINYQVSAFHEEESDIYFDRLDSFIVDVLKYRGCKVDDIKKILYKMCDNK